jgi:peptide/nickel transport system permease protein
MQSYRTYPVDVLVPGAALLSIAFLCFLWPAISVVPEPIGGNVLDARLALFSPGHLLGTDLNGNDVWSRLLYGGRVSLEVAIAVNVLGLLFGTALGAFAAFGGGSLDAVMMRVLDVLIAVPSLVLVLAIAQAIGPSELGSIWALTFFSAPAFARVARAATLRLREQPFVLVATLSGHGALRVIAGHILPNMWPQLMSFAMLGMGFAVILEGALSFLGLGVPLPGPSWGNMILHGQQAMSVAPRLVVLPSSVLFATVLSFISLGEALRTRWRGR